MVLSRHSCHHPDADFPRACFFECPGAFLQSGAGGQNIIDQGYMSAIQWQTAECVSEVFQPRFAIQSGLGGSRLHAFEYLAVQGNSALPLDFISKQLRLVVGPLPASKEMQGYGYQQIRVWVCEIRETGRESGSQAGFHRPGQLFCQKTPTGQVFMKLETPYQVIDRVFVNQGGYGLIPGRGMAQAFGANLSRAPAARQSALAAGFQVTWQITFTSQADKPMWAALPAEQATCWQQEFDQFCLEPGPRG